MKPVYARLHVLLAREADVGLVIRHGTAKSVCTLLWDRKKDKFMLGQWMRGRIDIETCDFSPDGKHSLCGAEVRQRVFARLDGCVAHALSKGRSLLSAAVGWLVCGRS